MNLQDGVFLFFIPVAPSGYDDAALWASMNTRGQYQAHTYLSQSTKYINGYDSHCVFCFSDPQDAENFEIFCRLSQYSP